MSSPAVGSAGPRPSVERPILPRSSRRTRSGPPQRSGSAIGRNRNPSINPPTCSGANGAFPHRDRPRPARILRNQTGPDQIQSLFGRRNVGQPVAADLNRYNISHSSRYHVDLDHAVTEPEGRSPGGRPRAIPVPSRRLTRGGRAPGSIEHRATPSRRRYSPAPAGPRAGHGRDRGAALRLTVGGNASHFVIRIFPALTFSCNRELFLCFF